MKLIFILFLLPGHNFSFLFKNAFKTINLLFVSEIIAKRLLYVNFDDEKINSVSLIYFTKINLLLAFSQVSILMV